MFRRRFLLFRTTFCDSLSKLLDINTKRYEIGMTYQKDQTLYKPQKAQTFQNSKRGGTIWAF